MPASLVSVVIPTFNRAYCLERAIDSVLHQTHRDVEVIVVDDGSTDGTRERLKSIYGQERRVRYEYQNNAGVSSARNRGIALASGDFVAFLDSDDEWLPWKLAVQLACLNYLPSAGMIWTDMDAVNPEGLLLQPKYLKTMYGAYRDLDQEELFDQTWRAEDVIADLPEDIRGARIFAGDIFSEMILGNLVHTSTVLMTRERLKRVKGFNEDLMISGEDYDFHLRTCREGPVAFLDSASIRYRVGLTDALTNPQNNIHIALNNLKTILPALEKDKVRITLPRKKIKARLAGSYSWIGNAYMDLAEPGKATPFLLKGLRCSPGRPRDWAMLLLSCFPKRLGILLRSTFRDRKREFAVRSGR